jgi:uncharacterized coiled-coil protein SlyX
MVSKTENNLQKAAHKLNQTIIEHSLAISKTEDNLQKAAHKLNQTITEHSLAISVHTAALMALKG